MYVVFNTLVAFRVKKRFFLKIAKKMKNLRQYDVIIIENQIFEKIKYDFRIP